MSFFFLTFALLLPGSDDPEPVAMVLFVQGDVKLRRMDMLRSGDVVRVPASGSVRLVYFADGHCERLKPAATVTITETGGSPAEAVKREKAKLPASHLDGLRSMAASARAGVSRVRDPAAAPLPLSPIHGATVLNDRPTFVWMPVPGVAVYSFRIFLGDTDREENLSWSESSAKANCDFPKSREGLKRGETYTWKVVARENEVVAQGTFTVATAEQAEDFEAVRKLAESADKSDRLLAAMLYEGGKVYGDCHRLFESLAKEMPAEPWVMMASARHLSRTGQFEEAERREKQALSLVGKPR
jgi:hypothetical protein